MKSLRACENKRERVNERERMWKTEKGTKEGRMRARRGARAERKLQDSFIETLRINIPQP